LEKELYAVEEDEDGYHVVKRYKKSHGNISELAPLSSNHPFVINLEQKKPKNFVRTLSIIGTFIATIISKMREVHLLC